MQRNSQKFTIVHRESKKGHPQMIPSDKPARTNLSRTKLLQMILQQKSSADHRTGLPRTIRSEILLHVILQVQPQTDDLIALRRANLLQTIPPAEDFTKQTCCLLQIVSLDKSQLLSLIPSPTSINHFMTK